MDKPIKNNVTYGKNNVAETIKLNSVNKIFLQKGSKFKDIIPLIQEKGIPYVYVDKEYLNNISNSKNHQGIVAYRSSIRLQELNEVLLGKNIENNPFFLILDEVQDPQNLGSIIRIADAFNIDGIIIGKRRSVTISETVTKVSTGAINYVNIIRVNNLRQTIRTMKEKGYWLGFLDMNGQTEVSNYDYNLPLGIVIGGEDKGVTESIKKECDFGLNIKMDGHVNSLNVASAVSILCHQKLLNKK